MRMTILQRAIGATVATAMIATPPVMLSAQTLRPRARPTATPKPIVTRVAQLPAGAQRPTSEVKLSIGEGELITLPQAATDVWISNPQVADVYVRSARQITLFGKDTGEATVFATAASGAVIYLSLIHI